MYMWLDNIIFVMYLHSLTKCVHIELYIFIVLLMSSLLHYNYHALMSYYVLSLIIIPVFQCSMPMRSTPYVSCRRYNSKVMAYYMHMYICHYYYTFTFTDKAVGGSKLYACGSHIMPTTSPRHVCTIIQVR